MYKFVILGAVATILILALFRIPGSAGASEITERARFMEQCASSYQEFECHILWKYGTYPTKPFIDMTGSPMEQVLATTAEPIRPRQKPEQR